MNELCIKFENGLYNVSVSLDNSSFNKELLANHIKTCVVDDIRKGNNETIEELLGTLQKLMK